jgi:hypothetical protein
MTRAAAAQALAAHGLAVFPVAADCRRPLTPHGYKDASKASETLRRWWARWPQANMAVACGAASGVFVLDVDVKGANGLRTLAELQAHHHNLPRTWCAATPNGGCHLWFRQPARELRNRVNFAPGLDCRTDGGSVAVPPSRKANGVYHWEVAPWDCPLGEAADWLLHLIDPVPVVRPPRPPIRGHNRDRLASYVAAAIDGECREVARMAANTGRNLRLFQAAARLGELAGAGLAPEVMITDALEAAADDCGLTREDGRRAVVATIASGLARGLAHPRQVVR